MEIYFLNIVVLANIKNQLLSMKMLCIILLNKNLNNNDMQLIWPNTIWQYPKTIKQLF